MRVAIVGAGISGLAAAYYLHRNHDILVFEKEDWIGGHACTAQVTDHVGRSLPVDVGFLVYNERTYPLFSALLRDIGAPTQPSHMSFSVRCRRCGCEYATDRLQSIVGNAFWRGLGLQHLQMLREILRFNSLARRWLQQPSTSTTLQSFLEEHRFSGYFFRHYIGPMTAAIWSAPPAATGNFPLAPFLRFLHNHGLLSVADQPQWRTIRGGSREYVRRLVAPFAERVQARTPVRRIVRARDRVELYLGTDVVQVDAVILAIHPDQALQLLMNDVSPEECRALSAIKYQPNKITLHTDITLLPRARKLWSSWNYHVADCRNSSQPLTMTYWINRLQTLPTATNFCVSVNAEEEIQSDRVLQQWLFHHPQYDPGVPAAQDALRTLNGRRRTFYCGAYLGYGFHEDGVRSALAVAQAIHEARIAA